MDVTKEITNAVTRYGGQPNSIASSIAAGKVLNFAEGGSIINPVKMGTLTRAPFTYNFKNTTGLFGAENQFIEIPTDIIDFFPDNPIINGDYIDPVIRDVEDETPFYTQAFIDPFSDNVDVNDFEFAIITNDIIGTGAPVFSVEIINKGTGNKYEDCWFDARLYTRQREEHPYDFMWLRPKDKFYVGFHARNTRRINFDVDVVIGRFYTSEFALNNEQRRYLPRLIN